jgi:hypothetical protein
MEKLSCHDQLPCGITICDGDGVILYMNDYALNHQFREQGGASLIGSSLFDCHSEDSKKKIKAMFETKEANVFTWEKKGVKRFIYEAPWYRNGEFGGFVELCLEIPSEIPNFIRD